MISHALKILVSELNTFFEGIQPAVEDKVILGNIATLESPTGTDNPDMREKIVVTLVNLREEKTLKNSPYSFANSATLKTEYFNPPVFVNLFVLFSATTRDYEKALTYIFRLIRFFQTKNIFTHLNSNAGVSGSFIDFDRLSEFKLIVDLYSPTFEELNHLWGTLGGKQHPSVLYLMRLLELKQEVRTEGDSVIVEIESNIGLKINN
ncbi:DUF4255 domain-containing protein [Adhaeribacter rhizoryzae]|uniref:DUF4255 domain-containing protein n=1 Tax=Adhaeribacter rhizoryzae TaxID=2607907 RepID=A0A5M6DQE0_9BACT|nr:DUF4255 domain-containing protein [Adhaeribacter rhizoryzae]KAA5548449.1 DUF4255 domain-containing protein [Adhaeribacter rhizoryzae]